MQDDMKNKTIIVTGAGGNIGRAYCDALIEAGAKLVMADLSDLEALACHYRSTGGQAIAVMVDVASEQDTRQMAQAALDHFGSIDGIINNAGFFKGCSFGSLMDIPAEEWDRCFSINVRGLWQCCKAVIPTMKRQG